MEILLHKDKLESVFRMIDFFNVNMETSYPKGGTTALEVDIISDRFYDTLTKWGMVLQDHLSYTCHSDFLQ